MQKERLYSAFLFIVLLSVLACTQRGDYFPLADCMRWEYVAEKCTGAKCTSVNEIIRIDGKETINGKKYFKMYFSRDGISEKLPRYIRKSKEGIFILDPKNKDEPEQLWHPLHLKLGQTHMIKLGSHAFTAEITLVGKDTLTLSNTTYENCLKFSNKIWHEKGNLERKLNQEIIAYYAPNTGLVKTVDNFPDKYTVTSTLIKYENPYKANLTTDMTNKLESLTQKFPLFNKSGKPPMPYEDYGACPFECCQYGKWIGEKEIIIKESRDTNSPQAFTVHQGEAVLALTGVVVTNKLGRAKVKKPCKIGKLQAQAGDILYVLRDVGEGYYTVWYKGEIDAVWPDDPSTDYRETMITKEPEYVWWVQIQNSRGQTGWTSETLNFDGTDACG